MSVLLWIILMIMWIISLTKWDRKCHCDLVNCKRCPYNGVCEWQKGDKP